VPVQVTRSGGAPPDPAGVELQLRERGLQPRRWGNGPGDRYGWHDHDYHKILYCLSGSIVFHTRGDGDVTLGPGDRLDVPPATEHAAIVGPDGVECVEAAVAGGSGEAE
jgi:quercetin dioxygenase-like cupin family protein